MEDSKKKLGNHFIRNCQTLVKENWELWDLLIRNLSALIKNKRGKLRDWSQIFNKNTNGNFFNLKEK